MTIDAPALWVPPSPAIIRPAEHALLKPGAFRPVTREERRAIIADLVRSQRLTFAEAKRAMLFVPVVAWKVHNFPGIVNSNTNSESSNTTSHTVNLPASIVAGNVLIVFAVINATSSLTTPTGWTAIVNTTTPSRTHIIIAKVATGSEGSTLTVAGSGSQLMASASYQVSGAFDANLAVSTVASGSSAAPQPSSLSPSWGSAKTLWFSFWYGSGSVTVSTYPTNYTLGQISVAGSGGDSIGVAAYQNLASSERSSAYSLSASLSWGAYEVAVRPA
jgi:tRNA threonylcarbamoyladenosine modification (KEOPS) complex Cgi121 subunit